MADEHEPLCASVTRCCARPCTTTCCPGERGELHLALARAFEDRAELRGRSRRRAGRRRSPTTTPPPATSRPRCAPPCRPRSPPREVHAYGEAADLAERALELWPRVPDADAADPARPRRAAARIAAAAHGVAGDRSRAEVLLSARAEELDPDADPRRYAELLARLSRIQWSLNRGAEAVETARAGAVDAPAGRGQPRARVAAGVARAHAVPARALPRRDEGGREALATAVAAGDRRAESEVLNTLGMAADRARERRRGRGAAAPGDRDRARGRRHRRRRNAYANLADTLNLAGRTPEALETAKEGLAAVSGRMPRPHDWMR